MSNQLLEIQPKELKFTVESKKQSSCSVQLTNNTHHDVAFKVKTTAPKKYSVKPNVGILVPKFTSEFIVTMQGQRLGPEDLACKDKFLIMSTIVPPGTTTEDITPSTFAKDDGKYVEEKKLKVILASLPHSPDLSPIHGELKNGLSHNHSKKTDDKRATVEDDPVHSMVVDDKDRYMMVDGVWKHGKSKDLSPELYASFKSAQDVEELKLEKEAELKDDRDAKMDIEEPQPKKVEKIGNDVDHSKLTKDIEDMKMKLAEIEANLKEAENIVSMLTEEWRRGNQETKILQEKLAYLSKGGVRKVQVGFPLLFVCMVALICVMLGYLLR